MNHCHCVILFLVFCLQLFLKKFRSYYAEVSFVGVDRYCFLFNPAHNSSFRLSHLTLYLRICANVLSVWDNIHGVFAHCAGAKTSDGSKFKNATTAGVEHIDVRLYHTTKLLGVRLFSVQCYMLYFNLSNIILRVIKCASTCSVDDVFYQCSLFFSIAHGHPMLIVLFKYNRRSASAPTLQPLPPPTSKPAAPGRSSAATSC